MKRLMNHFSIIILVCTLCNNVQSKSWENQAVGILPFGYGVSALAIVDENIIWAVAYDQNITSIPNNHISIVLKTTDGGENWESFDITAAEGRISFDIVAFDENTALITTQDFNNGNGRGVFKTIDGGITWEEKLHHPAGGVWIRFFNANEGVIINRQSIATTEDGGESWQIVPQSNITSFQGNEYTLLSSGNNSCQVVDDYVWFGTNKGKVYRSKDKGHSWEKFATSFGSDAAVISVAFKDTLNGIAINVTAIPSTFSKTTDGGETWEDVVTTSNLTTSNLTFVKGTDNTLIATSDLFQTNKASAYSNDFGNNWTVIDTGVAFGATQFISPDTGWSSKGKVTNENDAALFKWSGDVFVGTDVLYPEDNYKVFPNPFSTKFTIDNQHPTEMHFKLYNNDGQLIKSGKIDAGNSNLNVENLNLGVYYLELNINGVISTQKLIKAK